MVTWTWVGDVDVCGWSDSGFLQQMRGWGVGEREEPSLVPRHLSRHQMRR